MDKTVRIKSKEKLKESTDSENIRKEENKESKIIKNLLIINSALLVIILVLIMIPQESSTTQSKELEEISQKVNALDSFFANNIPEYNSPGSNPNPSNNNYGSDSNNNQVQNLEVDIENEPFKGDINAPVTIVEFSDYECPFCARFYSQTLPLLEEEYINTGKVKLVFKDFPLDFHPLADDASIAANCVFEQLGNEKYFEMHDYIFDNQRSLSNNLLNSYAKELGVDETKYNSCIEDPQSKLEVQQDLQEGSQLGVSGTPSFIINGELVVGAQPYNVLKQIIDQKLAEQ